MSDEAEVVVVPVAEEELYDVPEKFYVCEELPAIPHNYLGYFDVNLVNFHSGETICNVKLQAPRYGSDAPPFSLTEIRAIIEEEVNRRELNLLHLLFYDDAYKSYQYLSEKKAVQCTSYIFRALAETPCVAEHNEQEEMKPVEASSTKKMKNPYLVQPAPVSSRIKNALVCPVSNPSFPDRKPGQAPFVSRRDLQQRAAEHVSEVLQEREEVTQQENSAREAMRKERCIYDATIRAARTDAVREKALKEKQMARTIELEEIEREMHKRQKQLLGEVSSYVESIKAIEDSPNAATT